MLFVLLDRKAISRRAIATGVELDDLTLAILKRTLAEAYKNPDPTVLETVRFYFHVEVDGVIIAEPINYQTNDQRICLVTNYFHPENTKIMVGVYKPDACNLFEYGVAAKLGEALGLNKPLRLSGIFGSTAKFDLLQTQYQPEPYTIPTEEMCDSILTAVETLKCK